MSHLYKLTLEDGSVLIVTGIAVCNGRLPSRPCTATMTPIQHHGNMGMQQSCPAPKRPAPQSHASPYQTRSQRRPSMSDVKNAGADRIQENPIGDKTAFELMHNDWAEFLNQLS